MMCQDNYIILSQDTVIIAPQPGNKKPSPKKRCVISDLRKHVSIKQNKIQILFDCNVQYVVVINFVSV